MDTTEEAVVGERGRQIATLRAWIGVSFLGNRGAKRPKDK